VATCPKGVVVPRSRRIRPKNPLREMFTESVRTPSAIGNRNRKRHDDFPPTTAAPWPPCGRCRCNTTGRTDVPEVNRAAAESD